MSSGEPGEMADETLVQRTVVGDDRAFETLFARHEPLLRARLQRIIGRPLRRKVSISDVLQEARIAAHRACAGFEPRGAGSVRAWLLRIAELKAHEAIRRFTGVAKRDAGREVSQGARPDTDQMLGKGPSPSEAAIASELQEAVLRAMARLPDDHRAVLNLVGLKRLTFGEAAQHMDRSAEAIRKLYGRALSSFTALLAAERGDDDE